MTQTVYLKLSQITQVHEKNVPLASLGEVYCSEKSVESRCRAMIVKRIRGGGKQRESRLVGNVMEIIQQIEREIPGTSVQNLGETDYVIHYQPPRRQAVVWKWCKTLFVCLICFFGVAFAIMTFNCDGSVLDVLRKIYEITTRAGVGRNNGVGGRLFDRASGGDFAVFNHFYFVEIQSRSDAAGGRNAPV